MVYAETCQYHVFKPEQRNALKKVNAHASRTSCDLVNLVLDEEVYQGHECPEESACKVFSVFDGCWIWWAQRQASQRPWQRRDQV